MKLQVFALVLVAAAALFLMAGETGTPQSSDLTIHEWGTFTSVAGVDGSPIDWNTLGCKDDLPTFVNTTGYRNFKSTIGGTVRMETPVMYFYSSREVTANVKVQFPQGTMTEWYPKGDNAPGSVGIALRWSNVQVQPGVAADFPVEKGSNPYYAARATDAAPLRV